MPRTTTCSPHFRCEISVSAWRRSWCSNPTDTSFSLIWIIWKRSMISTDTKPETGHWNYWAIYCHATPMRASPVDWAATNFCCFCRKQLMILSQHKCRNSSISSVWPFPKMSKSEVLRFPPESVCAQPVITLKTVTRKRIKLYIMSNRTVKISSSSISRLTVKNFLPPVLAKIFSS